GIDCPTDCTEDYFEGDTVILSETPDIGSKFVKWTGPCRVSSGNCIVDMDSAKQVYATFTR
ncbi:TPA: hypothetical protein H1012_03370, partial [archaeon]|nr:hypothetical protein [Candidatus Naiadarchaeales archaeon SRR2090159.bin1288]